MWNALEQDGVLPVLGIVCFGTSILAFGPLFAVVLALVLVSAYFMTKEFRRWRDSAIHPHFEDPANPPGAAVTAVVVKKPVPVVDESSLVVRTMPPEGVAMTCEICLEDVLEGEQVGGSPNAECIHEFHLQCILHALQRRTTCPCCRREYVLLLQEESSSSSSSFDSSPNADIEQVVAIDPIVEEQVHHQSGVVQVSLNEEASIIP